MSYAARVELEPAYILHTRPYRETSLILEVFTLGYGRAGLVARGVRRPQSPLRGILNPFQPLRLSWTGKGELATLGQAEQGGVSAELRGDAVMAGFYVHELLLNLLQRHDPHPQLFGHYATLLASLAEGQPVEKLLRVFELELLREICGAKPAAQLSLTQFLIEQRQYGECASLFESLVKSTDAATLAAIPQTNDLINQLIVAEQPLIARELWAKLQPVGTTSSGMLWDGGFEYDERPSLPQFTWALHDSDFARVGYDDRVHHSGRQSLKLLFTGRDSTVLSGEARQRLALEPGRRYRFEAAVKGDKLVFTEGPRLAITLINGTPIAQSAPLPDGTWDWQTVTFEFVAPATGGLSAGVTFFDIVRTLKLAYDPPAKGALWFDDLKLVAMEN